MKTKNILKTWLSFMILALPACTLSMGMTQKTLPAGIAYTESILQKYSSDTPSFTRSSAIVTLSIVENGITQDKRKDVETLRKSFNLTAAFETYETGTRTSIAVKKDQPINPDFAAYSKDIYAERSEDGAVTVIEEDTTRTPDPEEDFYSYFDLPYIIDTLINKNSIKYLSSSLKSITETPGIEESEIADSSVEEHKFNNILTGFNINYSQKSGSWNFSIYSDYRSNEEYKDQLGFIDSSYTRFFRYSSIDSVKAHTLKYTFDKDLISQFEAQYEYITEDSEELVRGSLKMGVTYGA